MKNLRSNETKCFSVHQWLDDISDKVHFSMTNYQITSCDQHQRDTHTSNDHYYTVRIKTNATNLSPSQSVNASIKLFGRSHQTDRIPLDQTIDNQPAFQRNNSIDTFEIRASMQLNSLQKLELHYEFHSAKGKLSLEWIEVTNLSNGAISCFPVNRILTQSERGRRTSQILTLNESSNRSCSP